MQIKESQLQHFIKLKDAIKAQAKDTWIEEGDDGCICWDQGEWFLTVKKDGSEQEISFHPAGPHSIDDVWVVTYLPFRGSMEYTTNPEEFLEKHL